jgi:hypothetical protein
MVAAVSFRKSVLLILLGVLCCGLLPASARADSVYWDDLMGVGVVPVDPPCGGVDRDAENPLAR